MPGVDQAVEAAARSSEGWVAVLLVVIVASTFTFFGFVIKKVMQAADIREAKLTEEVRELQAIVRERLFAVVSQNSEAIGKMLSAADSIVRAADRMTATLDKFTHILDVRPCLLPSVEQRRLLKEFEDAESEK